MVWGATPGDVQPAPWRNPVRAELLIIWINNIQPLRGCRFYGLNRFLFTFNPSGIFGAVVGHPCLTCTFNPSGIFGAAVRHPCRTRFFMHIQALRGFWRGCTPPVPQPFFHAQSIPPLFFAAVVRHPCSNRFFMPSQSLRYFLPRLLATHAAPVFSCPFKPSVIFWRGLHHLHRQALRA